MGRGDGDDGQHSQSPRSSSHHSRVFGSDRDSVASSRQEELDPPKHSSSEDDPPSPSTVRPELKVPDDELVFCPSETDSDFDPVPPVIHEIMNRARDRVIVCPPSDDSDSSDDRRRPPDVLSEPPVPPPEEPVPPDPVRRRPIPVKPRRSNEDDRSDCSVTRSILRELREHEVEVPGGVLFTYPKQTRIVAQCVGRGHFRCFASRSTRSWT